VLPHFVLEFLQAGLIGLAIRTTNNIALVGSIARLETVDQLFDYLFEHADLVCALGCILSHG
jgi:hypothetical protein